MVPAGPCVGFLLLMQACHWEFVAGVDEISGNATVGAIVPLDMAIPHRLARIFHETL